MGFRSVFFVFTKMQVAVHILFLSMWSMPTATATATATAGARATSTAGGKAEEKEDRFYIYDWPSLDRHSTWPLPDETLVPGKAFRLDFQHVHSMNYGGKGESVFLIMSMICCIHLPWHLYLLYHLNYLIFAH